MTTDPDQFLLSRLKDGDHTALKMLFDQYFPPLMRQAYSIIKNTEVSEEITQDIFIYLWKSRDKISITTTLKAYLFQATRNRCFTHLRREFQSNLDSIDSHTDRLATDLSTDEELKTRDLEVVLNDAIASLPEKTRVVFGLSRDEEMSYQEISDHLEVSVKTVEYHLGNALKLIRSFLGKMGYLLIIGHLYIN